MTNDKQSKTTTVIELEKNPETELLASLVDSIINNTPTRESLHLDDKIKPGMKKIVMKAGVERYVHVDTAQLKDNQSSGKRLPTTVVVEDGKKYKFHTLLMHGPTLMHYEEKLKNKPNGVVSSIFLTTKAELEGYVDEDNLTYYEEDEAEVDYNRKGKWYNGCGGRLYHYES